MMIREATKNDAKAMVEYLELIAGESDNLTFGPGELPITVEIEEGILTRAYESDKNVFYIALEGEELVGNINFHGSNRKRIGHVGEFGISVKKAYWGRGIGDKLMDALLEWAPAHGIRKINLRVRADNEAAIALYKKKGFEQEGYLRCEYMIDGKCIDHLAMGLMLEEANAR